MTRHARIFRQILWLSSYTALTENYQDNKLSKAEREVTEALLAFADEQDPSHPWDGVHNKESK